MRKPLTKTWNKLKTTLSRRFSCVTNTEKTKPIYRPNILRPQKKTKKRRKKRSKKNNFGIPSRNTFGRCAVIKSIKNRTLTLKQFRPRTKGNAKSTWRPKSLVSSIDVFKKIGPLTILILCKMWMTKFLTYFVLCRGELHSDHKWHAQSQVDLGYGCARPSRHHVLYCRLWACAYRLRER